MKNILFICVENACRSQIAQAFAKIQGQGILIAYSAGSKASGTVNPKAIQSMQAIGYDLSCHQSKSLDEIPAITYDFVVTMGCGDQCPQVSAVQRIDWAIPDPKEMNLQNFNQVRDLIEQKVLTLIDSM